MRFRRPGGEHVAAVVRVDHLIRVRNILPCRGRAPAEILTKVAGRVVTVPAIRVRSEERPLATRSPAGAELERVEVVATRRVVQAVDDGQREIRRVQVESRDRRAVVGVAEGAVRARISDEHRDVECADRPIEVVLLRELIDPPPHDAGVDAEVRHQLVLDPSGQLARALILQVRIELRAADAAGLRGQQRLFPGLPQEIAVRIDPVVPLVPVDRVRIHGLVDASGSGVPPVQRVVPLQDRLAVAPEVVGEAKPWRGEVPRQQVVDRGEADLRRVERTDWRACLRRQVRSVPIEPGAQRQGQARTHSPRIGDVRAGGPQPVERGGRRQEQQDFRRGAAPQNVQHVAGHVPDAALPAQVIETLVEDLAAHLEVVAAGPAVLEVGERAEHLVPRRDVEPAVAVAAPDLIGAEIRVSGRIRVPGVRPLVMKLAAADLEEHPIVDDAIPLAFVGVGPVRLVPGGVDARVEGRRRGDEERVEPVGLCLLAPRPVPNQLVVRAERVGHFARDVAQLGHERFDGKIRQQRFRVLVAQRAVPP